MVNESIRIGLEQNLTSLKTLTLNLYHYLSDHTEFLKLYAARAIIVAKSKLKDFRKMRRINPRTKIPRYRKPYLIVDRLSYKIIGSTLLIGIRSRKPYVGIPLNHYTMQQLSNPDIEIGAVTITPNSISIAIFKKTQTIKPMEFVGIDTNLNNITAVHSDGTLDVFSDVSKITKVKERYRKVTSHFRRNDVRIRGKIFQKYGKKQKRKTRQILHAISKKLVDQKKQLIVEDLRGIRRRYKKGNGKGKKYRARLNGWPFHEFKRQLRYKSEWHSGISIIEIKPNKTSSRCSVCGAKIVPEKSRQIRCQCGHIEDRDINAARNIMYNGVQLRGPWLRPDAPQHEAMKQSKEDVEQIAVNQIYQL